ncbi:sodium channel protein Nach-like [Papilio machaon]|uniref:sodium channel protein Nach-like n=1 Tax=Papilio machaon TaxID=76193 RepID=UPI001E664727|nr:sodium channel protein Nach-like [Papilio machaon]
MFRTMLTYIGYCCKFDLTYFSLHAEEETNYAAGTEISEGLDITVNTDKYYSNGTQSDGYASLYVLDKDDKITILDNAITITTAAYFDATIAVWLMDSSADVQSLSLSIRKCFLDTDSKTGATSYQNCMMSLVMKKIIEYCQCIPFNFEAGVMSLEDFPACSWGRLICVYNSLEFIQGNIREVVSNNVCYQNCDYIEYETEVEYLKQDRTSSVVNNLVKNSRVTVHFKDNSCMKYRREVLYTWDQMLANLGGVFGLCLGGSIISIIEIIWFILDLMYTCCVSCKTDRVTPQSHRMVKEVFTISNKEHASKQLNRKRIIIPRFKFTQ